MTWGDEIIPLEVFLDENGVSFFSILSVLNLVFRVFVGSAVKEEKQSQGKIMFTNKNTQLNYILYTIYIHSKVQLLSIMAFGFQKLVFY